MLTIRKYREEKNMTQSELGELCGVNNRAVSMWENGDRKPDILMLKKLASIFGCTADDLLAGIDGEEKSVETAKEA